ncbi:mechanosensitive ion channel family protein [Campylobacter pinnipediorum subsp. caledonicus]|uniref:Mechanosensitive ion channel family protein n=1 Tax=Campylobacter pinnipediorum subsp. caledonicus TaxID=1874362 RepID=A0A1S6U789_9BACT|nr:mechanosensitive ion channel domain-containing protein [Campylobacter pinnipediorum]AQW85935.1 mechanosensitive ion channel family protein [Campylobacter pinnipediorum subsp. caledonicus]AQW87542.1 mechanosensitive ion channel family protein [Campylobacter pinnipediorum subsp. caledonicus]
MRFVLLFFIFLFQVFADNNVSIDSNLTNTSILDSKKQLESINLYLKNNIWMARYANYNTFQRINNELEDNERLIKKYSKDSKKKSDISKKIKYLKDQLELLKEYEKTPFSNMLSAPEVAIAPRITNPIMMISGFSYIKKIRSDKEEYKHHINELDNLLKKLKEKEEILTTILPNDFNKTVPNKIYELRTQISEFESAKQIADTTFDVYEKRADESINIATNDIKSQIISTINIAIFIIAIIAISFFFKFIAKKTITDNDRFYIVNKFINFINFVLIILTLLFVYIENVTYVVTVLGFASAGIAIAMKDMFMSMLGWVVIIFGGSIHVGDRVRVSHNGNIYVGDIIDISVLRMTLFEDVTLTTYKENRRGGRIVFIPNNYIFTELISNYSHHGMKTVWDGIDVVLSFDSNHKKAVHIAKTITRKYAKGYTDIAKRQMTRLRNEYSIKNPNVEPRVFTFFEPYGINVSIWFMSNSYATLTLRSTISSELIDAFNKEDDIVIAYPTQTMYFSKKLSPKEHADLDKEVLS